jgi:hypothetical protein
MKISRLQEGHINLTWKFDTNKGSFVIQNLLVGNIKAIEHNYSLLSTLDNIPKWVMPRFMSGKEVLEWTRNFEGDTFSEFHEYESMAECIEKDSSSLCWRIYPYIEGKTGESIDVCESEKYGEILGELHYKFNEINSRIIESGKSGFMKAMDHFHDTGWYFSEYKRAYASLTDIDDKVKKCNDIIEKLSWDFDLDLFGKDSGVIHGDARIANVVFCDGGACFIDMDTVMSGSPLVDIADMIRSIISHTGKDDISVIEAFMKAYNKANPLEKPYTIKEVQTALSLIRFELAVRYLTDYITGGGYFKEEYPGQSLDKAKKYLDSCL